MTNPNVRVGGLTFFGGAGSDGFYIKDGGLTGLFGGVGVRSDSIPRPQAHGDYDVPVFRSSRMVSIMGPCEADSEERLDFYDRQFTGLLADGQSGRVVFDMPGGPRWGDARLAANEFEPVLWGRRADYMLQLRFANPRLFGEARTFAEGVPAFHFGNFPAAPVLTVTSASAGGYTISGPSGKQFIVTAPLVSGHPHTIDMATGLLEVDGVVVFGGVSRADTWAVPAGAQGTMTVSGTAVLSALVTDTYI